MNRSEYIGYPVVLMTRFLSWFVSSLFVEISNARVGPYQLVHGKFEISSWRGAKLCSRRKQITKEDTRSRRSTKEDELRLCDIFVARGVERLQELQGEGWFEWVHGDDVAKTVFRMRNGHVEVYGYAFWVNQCTSGFHGVNEPGGVRVAREDDRRVTEGREDVREVFQQRGSGAKRKLSRCGRNQMGNEPILGIRRTDDFVVNKYVGTMIWKLLGKRKK
ncbi:hypothetical protein Tco_0132228 [Tanacetum coccineum]